MDESTSTALDVGTSFWRTDVMLDALANRDIGTVFRLLTDEGVYQWVIAGLVGLNSSEVSEVINGDRRIISYETLARICDALQVPRSQMGLASAPPPIHPYTPPTAEEEDMRRRELFQLALLAAAGSTLPEIPEIVYQRFDVNKIGLSDVEHLEALRGTLGSLNERFGAVPQHDASLALLTRSRSLLSRATMSPLTRKKLLSLTSRIHSHVGWGEADNGRLNQARNHFTNAVDLANDADDPLQVARALSFAARSELQFGSPNDALAMFQLGKAASVRARSRLIEASVLVHGAQAAVLVPRPELARRKVFQAYDAYDNVRDDEPGTLYPRGDITSAAAPVWHVLGDDDRAVTDAVTADKQSESHRVRSQGMRKARLSLFHLYAGNREPGLVAGNQAVEILSGVRSVRAARRLAPVAVVAEKYSNTDAKDLAHSVRSLL
jgi:transcriptional regulator with XRE-family HTH domain